MKRALWIVIPIGVVLLSALAYVALRTRTTVVTTPGGAPLSSSPSPDQTLSGSPQEALVVTADYRVKVISAQDGSEIREFFFQRESSQVPHAVSISPDRKIGFIDLLGIGNCSTVFKIDIASGETSDAEIAGQAPAVSPDGRSLAYAPQKRTAQASCSPAGVVIRNLERRTEQSWQGAEDLQGTTIYKLDWSAGGAKVAIGYVRGEEGTSDPVILDTNRKGPLALQTIKSPRENELWINPQFVPDGLAVLALCCDFHPDRDISKDDPHRLVLTDMKGSREVMMQFPQKIRMFSVDPSGNELMWITGGGSLMRSRRDGTNTVKLRDGILLVDW